MDAVLRVIGTISLAVAALLVWRARRELRGTTLLNAWSWTAMTLLAWIGAWCGTVLTNQLVSGAADTAWYCVAVLALCPPVAALGARRPGVRVWTWFILLPLLLVFGWPLAAEWQGALAPERLLLQEPVAVAYLLVLVMGYGNYLPTRYGLTAAVTAVALVLLIAPLSRLAPAALADARMARLWSTVLLMPAAFGALVWSRSRMQDRGLGHAWSEFRNRFGIVWARRVQDRVNDTGAREGWGARLSWAGIEWSGAAKLSREETLVRMEKTLRWLLRRFVDAEWLDRHLGQGEQADGAQQATGTALREPQGRIENSPRQGSPPVR